MNNDKIMYNYIKYLKNILNKCNYEQLENILIKIIKHNLKLKSVLLEMDDNK